MYTKSYAMTKERYGVLFFCFSKDEDALNDASHCEPKYNGNDTDPDLSSNRHSGGGKVDKVIDVP